VRRAQAALYIHPLFFIVRYINFAVFRAIAVVAINAFHSRFDNVVKMCNLACREEMCALAKIEIKY